MEARCQVCGELHRTNEEARRVRATHFRCSACDTLHVVSANGVERVSLTRPPPRIPPEMIARAEPSPSVVLDALTSAMSPPRAPSAAPPPMILPPPPPPRPLSMACSGVLPPPAPPPRHAPPPSIEPLLAPGFDPFPRESAPPFTRDCDDVGTRRMEPYQRAQPEDRELSMSAFVPPRRRHAGALAGVVAALGVAGIGVAIALGVTFGGSPDASSNAPSSVAARAEQVTSPPAALAPKAANDEPSAPSEEAKPLATAKSPLAASVTSRATPEHAWPNARERASHPAASPASDAEMAKALAPPAPAVNEGVAKTEAQGVGTSATDLPAPAGEPDAAKTTQGDATDLKPTATDVASASPEAAAAPAAPAPAPSDSPAAVASAMASADPAAAPSPLAPIPPPDDSTLRASLAIAASAASRCAEADGPKGTGHVAVTFAPSGHVTQAVVEGGPFAGTSVGACVARAFRGASVHPYDGPYLRVHGTFTVQ